MTPPAPLATARADLLRRLADGAPHDLLVVGGGATGLGVALDAAARGLKVLLLEARDFAQGTSSRSTKLLHGGVRYLAQGDIGLVREALHERTALLRNAPHLAQPLPFVMPSYRFWETPFYGAGLVLYDALAGRAGLGRTAFLNAAQTRQALPNLRGAGLRGGVRYWDGQFDDARLAIALARTAAAHGALLVNHCRVTGLLHEGTHEGARVAGVHCEDAETGQAWTVKARCVVNATGVWVDALREWDGQARQAPVRPMVAPSQGVHLVVDRRFMPGDHALLVPRTADGRVLFAVPWLGRLVLGTTDTPRQDAPAEPQAFAHEVDFILREAGRYLAHAPQWADVRSLWVGLRPLVRPDSADGTGGEGTQGISREHTVRVSASGLLTVTGGKWTTYRAMAEDVLDTCREAGLLDVPRERPTRDLRLVGAGVPGGVATPISQPPGWHGYGDEAAAVQALPGADHWLAEGLSEAMVRFAARHEYACGVEDVLARRSRLLFLDARLAAEVAPEVARLLREETGADPRLADFLALARRFSERPSSG